MKGAIFASLVAKVFKQCMQIIPCFLLTVRAKLPIGLSQQRESNSLMTLETLILSVAVLGTLQIAYRALKNMEARTVNGAPAWSSPDESDFVIESETDRAARRMKKDFDLDRAKSIMAMAEQFAANQAKA